MGYYDVQQVCENGHQITDRYNTAPQFRRAFCAQCGANSIHECPSCHTPIKGDYHAEGVVAVGFITPVPSHCENCGLAYPWVKVTPLKKDATKHPSAFNLLSWHGGLSVLEKFSLWGSLASIVGLALAFMPPTASSQNELKPQATTSGSKSPAIGSNQGNVTINYGDDTTSRVKAYVLRNAKGGASLVINKPSLDEAVNPSSHVCMAPAGTPIMLTGESAKMGNIDMWRKVKITSGECANKSGWVAIENVSIE